jgi:hypothetical protein
MTSYTAAFLTLALAGCSTKSTIDTADTGSSSAPAPTASSSGGCDWMGSYCYDFDGLSWDATSAEAACDTFNAGAAAEGAPTGTFVATGCPSGASAKCTGLQSDLADPGTAITLYYYDSVPLAAAQSACTDQGFTWTDL